MDESSVFLNVLREDYVAENALAFALADAFPVSPGHTLVVPRRNISDWWAATREEQVAILELVDEVKAQLDQELRPQGYNVGFNSGAAAGQTVFHLHVHVIPRYEGDVPDPRGGVRHVLPGGNYLVAPTRLWPGPGRPLGPALIDAVEREAVNHVDLVVSFVMQSGLAVLSPLFDRVLDTGGSVRVLATDYLGITEKAALAQLMSRTEEFGERFAARLFRAGKVSFHPKAYLLTAGRGRWAYVGSANASRSGLVDGVEWSLETHEGAAVREAYKEFELLWQDARALPLSPEVVEQYVQSPRPAEEVPVIAEPLSQPIAPSEVQKEALVALEGSRCGGFGAGMVVMATGLGKTWLAAFDSSRPEFRRVLFVAHREEILLQARAVFRRVRPGSTAGLLVAGERGMEADLVFASVQSLSQRLEELDPDAFDYVVVDEFHHAAAPTYRRLLGRLRPRFLLGLTATPDRADEADLLSLCEDNLVYECGLAEGIGRGLLCAFAYHGVPDPVDFRPLPWRNGRFDPNALEHAVISETRTAAAYKAWQKHKGTRTLAFCVSQRHADWMANHFLAAGQRAAAVHSSPTSAPRAQTLDQLRRGDLDVVFAVDMFNEGLDVPEVDTVLMLRPTSSAVLFLQQLGRGLRRAEGKQLLHVIDFIGNHRSFLVPLRVLAGLQDQPSDERLRSQLHEGSFDLPDGCFVDYELEARDDLLSLLPTTTKALAEFVRQWTDEHGVRPTAAQARAAGRRLASAKEGWFPLLLATGVLSADEADVAERWRELLLYVQRTSMTKSYKMVALRAWLVDDPGLQGQGVARNGAVARALLLRDPGLAGDVASLELPDVAAASDAKWTAYWRKWPLEHLVGTGAFEITGEVFRPVERVDPSRAVTLSGLLQELVEWRLAEYLARPRPGRLRLRVSHSSGRPIIRFDRRTFPQLPSGRTALRVGSSRLEGDFKKIALNVVREQGEERNVLPDLLWRWFGPEAGQSGTVFEVELFEEDGHWHLAPAEISSEAGVG